MTTSQLGIKKIDRTLGDQFVTSPEDRNMDLLKIVDAKTGPRRDVFTEKSIKKFMGIYEKTRIPSPFIVPNM